MVIKEDGTKWACQSCLKGHRVSGCSHTDRELTLVPKKGRPVTQCQHCRLERKKRSAHVKCDCGEADKPHHPREKCIHLREAEERVKAGSHDGPCDDKERDGAHLAAVAEEQGCCCHHGGSCTCAHLKKDPDTDSSMTPPHGPAVKPRLESTRSDGSITVFQNGHHKPVHRKNHLAHECGMPYKMPMPRSHTDQPVARRSVDSLALDNNMSTFSSAYNPLTSAPFNSIRRTSKSEQPSPKLFSTDPGSSGPDATQFADLDFNGLGQVPTNQSLQSATSDDFGFPSMEPLSAVDGTFDYPWQSVPSGENFNMPDNNPFGVWPTNESSAHMTQPALTAASSGTQSEIDEIPPMEDVYGLGMPSIEEDVGNSTINSVAYEASPQSNRRSLPPNFFSSTDIMGPTWGGEWPTSRDEYTGSEQSKFRQIDMGQASGFNSSWQMPNNPPTTQRAVYGLSSTGRPASQSVGALNAPNTDDVMRQLFPEIVITNTNFSSPVFGGKTQALAPTSVPTDFEDLDGDAGFTSQPWSDGSLSVPNDPYTSSFDVDEEFADATIEDWRQ